MKKKHNIDPTEIDPAEIVKDISHLYMWDFLPEEMKQKFCAVDDKGCSKYKECELSNTHLNCYHNKKGWCTLLINERRTGKFHPNPSGILMRDCRLCRDPNYRDCNPCPYYGCVLKGESDSLCPYLKVSRERNVFEDFRFNPYGHIWCYITRQKFRQFQRSNNLWAASFIYKQILKDDPESYYLMKNTIAPLQFLSTHFINMKKTWEPIEDEQLRWHLIAAVRKKEAGLRQFKLLQDYKRLTDRERDLGILIVEDGEFSFFLLLWRLKRLSESCDFDDIDIDDAVSIALTSEENTLLQALGDLGISNKWSEIQGEYIKTSILDEFKRIGLITCKKGKKSIVKATDRFRYLVYWLQKLKKSSGKSVFSEKLTLSAKWQELNLDDLSREKLQEFARLIVTVDMDSGDIDKIARFPLEGHYYLRRLYYNAASLDDNSSYVL